MTRLFDVAPKAKRVGTTTALVALDPDVCPSCGGAVICTTLAQGALVRHGGYGATTEVVTAHCDSRRCRWSMQRRRGEVSPRIR